MTTLAIPGLHVLDLSEEWGAYCTKLLADLGADVLRVEPPAGGAMRTMEPRWDADGVSAQDVYYHANKRGVTLDVERTESREILTRLIEWCDVVVHGGGAAGAAVEAVVADGDFPDLIVCAVTGFGRTGPYRDLRSSNLVAHAMGGGMYILGPAEGPPAILPVNEFVDLTGTHAALAILAATRVVGAVGGQTIDIAAHEVLAGHDAVLARYATHRVLVPRVGDDTYAVPSGSWECEGGLVEFQVWTVRQWHGFRALVGDPQELADPALDESIVRGERAEELRPIIAGLLAGRSAIEVAAEAQRLQIPSAVVNQPADLLEDPHARDRQMFVEMEHPSAGRYEVLRSPFRSEPAIASYRRAAALIGEHNSEVYVDVLGFTPDEVDRWRSEELI